MLNCGLSIIFLPAAGIFMLVKYDIFADVINEVWGMATGVTAVILVGAIMLIASMNDMATPSLSLEGKSIWLAQSLPITAWQLVKAKINMQILLSGVPALFAAICSVIACKGSVITSVLIILSILVYVILTALVDCGLGIWRPNLSWNNELTPIKQSLVVFLALMFSWIFPAAYISLFLWKGLSIGADLYMSITLAVMLLLSFGLYLLLKKKSADIIESL